MIVVDDGAESLMSEFLEDERSLFTLKHYGNTRIYTKIKFPNDTDDILKNYQLKTKIYPMVSRETMEWVCLVTSLCSIWTTILVITKAPLPEN